MIGTPGLRSRAAARRWRLMSLPCSSAPAGSIARIFSVLTPSPQPTSSALVTPSAVRTASPSASKNPPTSRRVTAFVRVYLLWNVFGGVTPAAGASAVGGASVCITRESLTLLAGGDVGLGLGPALVARAADAEQLAVGPEVHPPAGNGRGRVRLLAQLVSRQELVLFRRRQHDD